MVSDLTVSPLSERFLQGCPLSMLLCLIAARVLPVFFIDTDTRAKGIMIGELEIKKVNFADDIT